MMVRWDALKRREIDLPGGRCIELYTDDYGEPLEVRIPVAQLDAFVNFLCADAEVDEWVMVENKPGGRVLDRWTEPRVTDVRRSDDT